MTLPDPDNSMILPTFAQASRRTFLRRSIALAAVAGGAGIVAACSPGDAETFGADAENDGGDTAPSATQGPSGETLPPVTGSAGSSVPADPVNGPSVQIAFTYTTADAGRRVHNPYIAVWLEDSSGNVAAVVSLWYQAQESKYLRDLTSWDSATGSVAESAVDAISGATRVAGDYVLEWDGVGVDGTALTGDFTLFIESARERGPHHLTSGSVALGAPGSFALPDDGELSRVTVTLG